MPRAKKETTADAVEKVKAVAEDAKEAVVAAAETVAEKAEPVVKKVKAAAKSAAKPRRSAAKSEEESKPAKTTRTKKAEASVETKVVIELPNVSESADSLVSRAKADWLAKGNAQEDMKQLTLYINAAEAMVYYVVNDDYLSGNFAI
ncbi:MAG TPA: hypothetical protein DCG49_00325 [Ruminococcus sp.]|nr:hypothetical protein [Ruminococcus sp.]